MKRQGNLLQAVADPDNLREAFYRAAKGLRKRQPVQRYAQQLDKNLLQLRQQILSGQVDVGHYRQFQIFDPKPRVITACAFPEKVLHHALMMPCHQRFEAVQIFDSYASRPGKGVHAAVHRGLEFHHPGNWFLKLDVKKFFDSVNHAVLQQQLKKRFREEKLLAMFRRIINSYHVTPGAGVPIGNLTSQYFANHFLAELDHFIKEKLKCARYIRYMDDMVLWHKDKDFLKSAYREIRNYVVDQLHCQLKPALLNATHRGLPFCGYLILPGQIRLTQRSRRRFQRKLAAVQQHWQSGEWDEQTCQRHVIPLVATTRFAEATALRQATLNRLEQQ